MAEALEEVIHIGRETGIRILVTHFKLRGRRNWGNARRHLDTIDRARGEGIDIGIAQYPYTANSTFMHVVVPPWYHSRGTDGLLKALAEEREQVKKDMLTTEGWENFSQVMGWENIYVSSVASEKNLWCEGKSAVALGEALKPEFKTYQQQIVKNAAALARALMAEGFDLVSGGTDNHLMLVDLRPAHLTGKEMEHRLDEVYITVNKNAIPNDPEKPFVTSGIRVGTPAATSRGFKEEDMAVIARLMWQTATGFETKADDIRAEVARLTAKYPLYE